MDNRACLDLMLRTGQMLLESGAETFRAEDAALYIFNRIGEGSINIFAVPTMVIIEIRGTDGQVLTGCKRIRHRSTHLGKFEQVNDVARRVSSGELSAEAALLQLDAIDCARQPRRILTMLAMACAAGLFSLLITGGPVEAFFAFVSCFLAQCAGIVFSSVSMYPFFSSMLGGLVPTLVMLLVHRFLPQVNEQTVVIASMLPLFPGVSTVNAIRDAINDDLISGVSRAAEAVMIAVGLGIGASFILLLEVL